MGDMKTLIPLAFVALLAACSSQEDTTVAAPDATASVAKMPAPTAPPSAESGGGLLTLEGLGDLAIGKAVPAGSSFTSRADPMPGSDCNTLSSPRYPGVYALVEGGVVRRITVAGDSKVKLVEGVGVGSTEQQVLSAFPGFRSEPHKYVGGNAKYLTQPGDDPRLRFEIGEDGKVTDIHVGMNPQLSYVEGCS